MYFWADYIAPPHPPLGPDAFEGGVKPPFIRPCHPPPHIRRRFENNLPPIFLFERFTREDLRRFARVFLDIFFESRLYCDIRLDKRFDKRFDILRFLPILYIHLDIILHKLFLIVDEVNFQ